ncbi:MAG: hypothetical protein HGA36_01240 [Candidatus Moranbacteria bacterium]|nr:hypothetical protein [Candidatus Moranbacteria bacterium]
MAEQKSTFKKVRKYFFWIILISTLVVGFFFWRQLQKPASGRIKMVTQAPASVIPVDGALERFEGEYFSFAHDAKYLLKNHRKDFENNGVILESAFFAQADVNSKKIAVTVEDIRGRGMADTGNFLLREKNPKVYAQEKFDINGAEGISFSTTNESGFLEKVFFIPKGEYVAEFAFTQPITEDGSSELEMTEILKSIQWKK